MRTSRVDRYERDGNKLGIGLESILGIGASLLGGAIGSKSSSDAAKQAAQAQTAAAQAQAASQAQALAFQREMYQDQLARSKPYYGTGTNALAQLSSLYGLYQPRNFSGVQSQQQTAQTGAGTGPVRYDWSVVPGWENLSQEEAAAIADAYRSGGIPIPEGVMQGGVQAQTTPQTPDPLYDPTGMEGFYGGPEAQLAQNSLQVAMQRGLSGLDRSAAASGGLLSGAQAKAMSDYAQGTNQQYMQSAYGDYSNRLAAMAGIGQTAYGAQDDAGMGYGNAGATAYGNIGSANADALASAGQYQAYGTAGAGNAWGNAFNQIARTIAPSGYGQSGNMPSWMSGSLSAQVDASGNPRYK